MSGSVGGDSAEPNLVPVLDMVFQLITFFMLVMNFKAAALDMNLKLPVVGSAQPANPGEEDNNAVVLNINKEGVLTVAGQAVSNIPAFAKQEGEVIQLAARRFNPEFKPGDDLPATIVIRADQETRFNMLYRVIKEFQQQGFHHFHYMAVKREE